MSLANITNNNQLSPGVQAALAAATNGSGSAAAADGTSLSFDLPAYDGGTTLTPDSLMAYCQARLDSIDGQAETLMKQQNDNAAIVSQIQNVANEFKTFSTADQRDPTTPSGTTASGAQPTGNIAKMQHDLQSLIDNVTAVDPNSSALTSLQSTMDQLNSTATDNLVTTTEIEGFSQNITDSANSLNSESEMQMVQLQSLMSQRQTAISLTTNLVQSLGDQENKIADNIGK
jgi:hypothetical protein